MKKFFISLATALAMTALLVLPLMANGTKEAASASASSKPSGSQKQLVYFTTSITGNKYLPWFYVSNNPDWRFVWNRLVENDESWQPKYPDLATSWTSNADGTKWDFQLRKGVKFQDGTPFSAQDVKFSVELTCNPGALAQPYFKDGFSTLAGYQDYVSGQAADISGVKILGDYEVEFDLTEPNALFLSDIAMMGIVPAHALKGADMKTILDNPFWEHPIGTGPYKLTQIVSNQYIVFDANKDYYAGAPKIQQIVLRKEDMQLAVANGQTDVIAIGTDSNLAKQAESQYKVLSLPMNYIRFFRINITKPPFDNVNFRKALLYGLPRDQIVNTVYGDSAVAVDGLMGKGYWLDDNLSPQYNYDPDKAKQLLAQSGYDGRTLELMYLYGDPQTFNLLSLVQAYYKKIGINITLAKKDGGAIAQLMGTGGSSQRSYDFYYGAEAYFDPSWLADLTCKSTENFAGYCNPQFDSLIKQGIGTVDKAARQKIYFQAEQLLNNDAIVIPFYTPEFYWAISKRLDTNGAGFTPGEWFPYLYKVADWQLQ